MWMVRIHCILILYLLQDDVGHRCTNVEMDSAYSVNGDVTLKLTVEMVQMRSIATRKVPSIDSTITTDNKLMWTDVGFFPADITVLSNIAGAAIASTVAVVIIGFAIASVVHLYRKRKKHEESLQARPIVRPPPGYSDDLGFYPHVVPGPLPYVLRNEPPPFYTSQELLISAGSVTDPTIQSAYLLPPYSVREARIVEPPPDYFGNAPGVHNMTPLTNEGITVVTHMADHTSAGQGELRADVMEAERTIDSDDEEST